ncbi:hypothetical protein SAMD00019534_082500 [Acytostelium subglobosum LB1]|uniref:hypothetical protein n=1 Tax=Acytostelium subglobosum LB1 TaxID=1410327 RepID=UPI0006447D24|nr:hypothetical protein SAMD00019534_082500 [Acytostelium subglobosum LB1]GAM25075.1 hypothetical protein SAMD00019534_082500 [Acytostelium subglobosum LB1]|eukprot:XP_012752164.1 hypothetical protein SAMD00019534_082500 [Acytostelium subglobosum LB1]
MAPPRPESVKKAKEVLGDFNPSEDKLKKTLGIGDEELKQVHELRSEQHHQQMAKERIPINKRETRKAQSTLGLNLSKEKLMDVLGVDEDTITEAENEEKELKELRIRRLRENIILSNKKALRKAFTLLGFNPSSSKMMRTLGVSEADLAKDVSAIQQQHQQLQNLVLSAEITLFLVILYIVLWYFKYV